MAQSCRGDMARLSDFEEKAEELEAELISQQDMEDRVNKLDTLISDRLQNSNQRMRLPSVLVSNTLESRLKAAMGGWTRICDELRKLKEDTKSQSDGMRELEKILEEQADELRADLKSHDRATIGLVLNHLPEKRRRHLTVTAEIEGDEENVAWTNAATERMRVTSDSCRLAATAGQRLKARERTMCDLSSCRSLVSSASSCLTC